MQYNTLGGFGKTPQVNIIVEVVVEAHDFAKVVAIEHA